MFQPLRHLLPGGRVCVVPGRERGRDEYEKVPITIGLTGLVLLGIRRRSEHFSRKAIAGPIPALCI